MATEKAVAERDIFKERPLRYLGYANEVGEAFRHTVPVKLVRLTYLLASGYVFAHAVSKGHKWSSKDHTHSTPTHAVVDTLVWQGLASVAIPGFTINRLCSTARWSLNRWGVGTASLQRWTVVGVGLSCIPFIINPIDRLVDYGMDHFRPLVKKYMFKDNPTRSHKTS
jgi:fission process protein 1